MRQYGLMNNMDLVISVSLLVNCDPFRKICTKFFSERFLRLGEILSLRGCPLKKSAVREFVQGRLRTIVRGSSDADVRTFCCKNFAFFKFMVCLHGQRGRELSQCEHFSEKGVSIFHDFVRTFFMDGPWSDNISFFLNATHYFTNFEVWTFYMVF